MDIIYRLRGLAAIPDARADYVMREAADEIERLRALLARYRDETPLGNQPHMIAHEVDQALGRESEEPMPKLPKISDIDIASPRCTICHGYGWVCENHPREIAHECPHCEGAGMPCPCNFINNFT